MSIFYSVFESELDNLYDGIWVFTVFATDAAGHRTAATTNFRVGPEPADDEGAVLGVVEDISTGVGGLVNGLSNFISGDSEDVDQTNEEEIQQEEESQEPTGEESVEGAVLGVSDTDCAAWKFYLPILLLLVQVMVAFSAEIANRQAGSKKLLFTLGLSGLTIGLFYLLRDVDCYVGDSTVQAFANWFIPLSLIAALISRAIGMVALEEK